MRNSICRTGFLVLVAIFCNTPFLENAIAADDVILEPDPLATVEGTVGLANETFGSGRIYTSAGGGSYNSLFESDGQFSVTAIADSTLALNIYMYSFQNTSNATLRQYVYNQPPLVEDEIRVVDLRRPSGRIAGTVSVVGGSVEVINMATFSYDSTVPEQFTGSVSVSAPPYIAEQPAPPLPNTRVSGSVRVRADTGCSATLPLASKYIEVVTDAITMVKWEIDVTGSNCNTGSLQGNLTVTGLDGQNSDATVNYRRAYVNGPEFRSQVLYSGETQFTFSNLPVGSYNFLGQVYFNPPYYYLSAPWDYNVIQINEGEITTYNRNYPVGTAHGSINLVGSWGLADIDYAQVQATPTGFDYADLTTGAFDLVLAEGTNEIYYNFFRDNDYDSQTGDQKYWYTQQYRYGDHRLPMIVQEGERIDLGVEIFETSQTLVKFEVAQQEGQPEAQITRLRAYGRAYDRDPVTNALKAQMYINEDDRRAASSTFPVEIRGLPGSYAMQAIGYGTDGRQYRASFDMTLGAPDITPPGTDVEIPVTDASGAAIGTITFDSVTEGGETTVSQVSIGKNPPRNFKVFKGTSGQPQYFDITTTAIFDGSVEVCLHYDDSNVSDPTKEADMELAHDDEVVGDWVIITKDGYPDIENNIICGIVDSFSIFAILEVDIIDSDDDGVIDEEDNCPMTANADQADFDTDGIGDACDVDSDGDDIPDATDLCPNYYAIDNNDLDGDGVGDPCDGDVDGDDVANASDNCPVVPNGDQGDFDYDTLGDACDTDDDGDNVPDVADSCPGTALGAVIDSDGCSSGQRFEKACPSDSIYRNHGKYVSCIAKEAERQVELGLITVEQKGAIVSAAAQSDVGK